LGGLILAPRRILNDPDKLSTMQVADLLEVSRTTLHKWVVKDKLPEELKPSVDASGRRTWTQAQVNELKRWVK
jgi:predicted site-specific integrase-resolvase